MVEMDKVCIKNNLSLTLNNFVSSLDTPYDSGDHENYFVIANDEIEIYGSDGTLYNNCSRKAVHIREIETQIPWHSLTEFTLVFSNLSTRDFDVIDHSSLLLEFKSEKVKFTRAVDASFGWEETVFHKLNLY